jgi:hypothetical protein
VAVVVLLALVLWQWTQRGAGLAPAADDRHGALARGHVLERGRTR